MDRLLALPMQKGWIYETIVSTYSDGEPHAAPMGVWAEGPNMLHLEIFRSSRTLSGILDTKQFTVGFPSDVGMFHTTLFHPGLLTFGEAHSVSAPVLLGTSATAEVELRETTPLSRRVRVAGEVMHAAARPDVRLVNRAEGLLLESLILATRLRHLDEAAVRDALAENHRVIRKVAPGSTWEAKMAELLRDIGPQS